MRIGPGTYREQVVLGPAKHDVVVRGTDRNRVVLDGGAGARSNGITIHADGVAVENLTVRGFASDAVLFTPPKGASKQLDGWRASYVTVANNGLHGIDALGARGGTIDHVWASGHGAAGLRIGDCRPCDSLVTDSVAERGMAGFEGADSGGNVVVARSFFRDNRVGVLLVSAGKEAPLHQQDTTVVGNVIANNDNPSAPGRGDDFGVGVLVRGGRRDGLARNRITGHPGAGVLLTASDDAPAAEDSVQGNVLRDNGVDLAVAPRAGQRTSKGSCFAQNQLPHVAAGQHREGAALPVRRPIAHRRARPADASARRRLAHRAPARAPALAARGGRRQAQGRPASGAHRRRARRRSRRRLRPAGRREG